MHPQSSESLLNLVSPWRSEYKTSQTYIFSFPLINVSFTLFHPFISRALWSRLDTSIVRNTFIKCVKLLRTGSICAVAYMDCIEVHYSSYAYSQCFVDTGLMPEKSQKIQITSLDTPNILGDVEIIY